MNYETLIENLRQEAAYWRRLGSGSSATAGKFEEAASAIEALIAEQKAMLGDLRSAGCSNCKHRFVAGHEYPCNDCKRSDDVGHDHWQRRGIAE